MIKEEVGPLLEAGDQDYLPHRKRFFGHKKAEQQLIGKSGIYECKILW